MTPIPAVSAAATAVSAGTGVATAGAYDGLHVLDRYVLPYSPGMSATEFNGTAFGGISGLDYDAVSNSYYAISDDRSQVAPPGRRR